MSKMDMLLPTPAAPAGRRGRGNMATTSGLRDIEFSEHYEFHDAHSLLVWLQQFKDTDLHGITINHGEFDYLSLQFETEILSDGSRTNNIRVN